MVINLEKIPLKESFYASCAINVLVIAFALIIQKRLPPEVPIFYGLPQGETQLVSPLGILIPSVSSAMLILLNVFLVNVIRDEFIKKTLVIAGLATAIFAAITTLRIIFLVGRI